MSTRNWRFGRCISLSKWWCSGSMLGSRGVSGVNHKRSAGPNAQWTSSRSVLNMAIAALEMFEMLEPSVSTSVLTVAQLAPKGSRRFQVDTKHLKGVFFGGFNTRKKKQTWIFQEWFCVYFFCFGCFCHFGSLMFRTVLENTIKCCVSLLVYSLIVHADAFLFACSLFDSKIQFAGFR